MIIKNLKKIYDKNIVVDNVDFEIPEGKVTSLIGPNGAGKSTVMHLLSRLIKRDGGNVYYANKDILDYSSDNLAKKISILTQTNNINSKITVKDLVSFGRFPHSKGILKEKDYELIEKSLDCMKIKDIEDRFINELSGGQRQRVFIAMILCQDTDYILLDEPTNNLDIYHASELMKLIKDMAKKYNKTVVLVLHEINLASFYSDYIIAFKDAKIALCGDVNEVITKENLKFIYGVDFKMMEVEGKPLSIYY